MTVLSYLTRRAASAILSDTEQNSIRVSIATLGSRLISMYGVKISEHFRFGSSTRSTILPRALDEHSDIDYMVVFSDGGLTPQSYLDRLRRFADAYYQSSSIKQSSPTIVLELNHIKFDLAPALKHWWDGYSIPDGAGGWLTTNPNDFNETLSRRNNECGSLIKPTIRLVKMWNAANGYVFESYGLEKWIVGQSYWMCTNLRDYVLQVIDMLSPNTGTQWRDERIRRAKQIVMQTRTYESQLLAPLTEAEIAKLFSA
jgi:hypothetical protein